MPSSDFRPRLPIDPFATADALTPWYVPKDLPHSPPQVILILGEPQQNELLCLLTSPHLTSSVLLIATHALPLIPVLPQNTPGPAVRVLRLSSPLAVHDSGALRLVNLFEKACRVSERWRESIQSLSSSGERRFVQLAECSDSGEFIDVEPFLFVDRHGKTVLTVQSHPTPLPSASLQRRKSRLSSLSLRSLKSPPSSGSKPSLTISPTLQGQIQRKMLHQTSGQPSLVGQKDGFRAFDALLNFLPSGVPDKALLKHAILVTTLSPQYLAMPNSVETITTGDESKLNHDSTTKSNPRFSVLSFRSSSSSSFSSLIPSSTRSSASMSMSPSTSMSTTSVTPPSPSPSLLSSQRFSQEPNEPPNSLNPDAPKIKAAVKASLGKRFSSFLRPPPPSASSASASSAADSGTSVAPYVNGPAEFTRVTGDWDEYGNTRPHDVQTRPKNSHLVHILPHEWEEREHPRDRHQPRDGRTSGQHSHTSEPLPHQNNVTGDIPSSSKRRTSGSSLVSPKPKLVQGIEQFLLSFAYPLGSLGFGPGGGKSDSRPGSNRSTKSEQTHSGKKPALRGLAAAAAHAQTRPVPYLVAPAVFGRALEGAREESLSQESKGGDGYDRLEGRAQKSLSIGEVILLGALDFDPEEAYGQNNAYTHSSRQFVEDRGNARAVGGGRAWVGIGDVVCSKGAEREKGEIEERVVVGKEERDRSITEGWSEESTSYRTSTNRMTSTSSNVVASASKAAHSQSPLQLPTPPDSRCSSMEEHDPRHKYHDPAPPHQPTRVNALTEYPEPEREKDWTRVSRRATISASTTPGDDELDPCPNPTPAPMSKRPSSSSAAQGSATRSSSNQTLSKEDLSTNAPNGPPPLHPDQNHLRAPGVPIAASAGFVSTQMPRVEGPAIPPAAHLSEASPHSESTEKRDTRNPSDSVPSRATTSNPSELPGAVRQIASGSKETSQVPATSWTTFVALTSSRMLNKLGLWSRSARGKLKV